VPIFDTAWAILRRARTRTSPATADKNHLHHRLMRLGHGHRRSVFILWGWTALLSVFVLYPTYTHSGDAIVPIGILALGLVLYTVLHPRVRQTHRADVEASRHRARQADEAEGAMATVEDPVPIVGPIPRSAPTPGPTAESSSESPSEPPLESPSESPSEPLSESPSESTSGRTAG
jgi:hypothetical protein